MENNLKTRPFVDSDWTQFETFAEKNFGFSHIRDRKFNEHWFRTPLYDGWAAKVAEDPQGKIIGMMMVITVRAKFGETIAPLGWISSGAVEEESRPSGVGAMLYFWIYKTFPLVGTMSGNDLSNPINSTLGKSIPGVSMNRFITLHRDAAIELCKPEHGDRLHQIWQQSNSRNRPPLTIMQSETIPSDYEELWNRVRNRYFFCVERDRNYLEWRYLGAPYIKYQILEVRSPHKLRALAVCRFQETPPGQVCRVVDFIAEKETSCDSWTAIKSYSEKQGALFTDFMVIGNDQDEPLLRSGFLKADDKTGLNAIPHLLSPVEYREWTNNFHLGGYLAKANQEWRHAGGVYFTKGDSDRDWPTAYDLERMKREL